MQVWVIGLSVAECVWGWALLPPAGVTLLPLPSPSLSPFSWVSAPVWLPGRSSSPSLAFGVLLAGLEQLGVLTQPPESQPRGSHQRWDSPPFPEHAAPTAGLPRQGKASRGCRLGIPTQWLHHPSPGRGDSRETDGSLSIKTSFIRKVKKPPDTIA